MVESFIRWVGSTRIISEFYSGGAYLEVSSFYNEQRSKPLKFVRWVCGNGEEGGGGEGSGLQAGVPTNQIDLDRRFLFGFSDGAILGVGVGSIEGIAYVDFSFQGRCDFSGTV